jgi:hypothetical protein
MPTGTALVGTARCNCGNFTRGVWKRGSRLGRSGTARRKRRKQIRRAERPPRHTPTLPLKPKVLETHMVKKDQLRKLFPNRKCSPAKSLREVRAWAFTPRLARGPRARPEFPSAQQRV